MSVAYFNSKSVNYPNLGSWIIFYLFNGNCIHVVARGSEFILYLIPDAVACPELGFCSPVAFDYDFNWDFEHFKAIKNKVDRVTIAATLSALHIDGII